MELLKPDNAQKGTGIEQATSKGVLLLLVAAAEGRVVGQQEKLVHQRNANSSRFGP